MSTKIGIIGGSGLDNPNLLSNTKDIDGITPFGSTSSCLRTGEIGGVPVVLMARHGHEHSIPPAQVNYRANIHALKEIGCTHLLVSTAVGSLRAEIQRGDLIVLDQFIDFTRQRKMTFHESYKPNEPVHPAMPDPFDAKLRTLMIQELKNLGYRYHPTGTVITIEGPRFSTRAESRMYRIWGADVVNMSVSTECMLASEAGLPYAAIAMSTDYDAWKDDEEPVTWEAVSKVAEENANKVLALFRKLIPIIGS